MATTRFNSIISAAASSLQAARTTAGPAGDSSANGFTSSVLAGYANRAVRDFLRDTFASLKENFGNLIPEYVKRATLTLTAGTVALPSDAWIALDLQTSDHVTKFRKLDSKEIDDVMAGEDAMMIPSLTQPVFWQEGSSIYTLGVVSGNVILRYIMKHEDLTVITTAVGNGLIYNMAASIIWTAATNLLTITDSADLFATGDENKLVMFRTATVVYVGRVLSQGQLTGPKRTVVTLFGDGLPAGNIAAPNIIEVVRADVSPDVNDIRLNDQHFGEIIRRMVEMGHEDEGVKV